MTYLYITENRFTNEDATAVRILSFCKLLHDLGKEVIVISLDEVEINKIHTYKGVKYVTLRSPSKSFFGKIFNILFHKIRLQKSIAKLSLTYKLDGLFFYDIPPPSILYLKKYAENEKIKVFHDSVEWYSPEQFRWGIFALPYILKNVLNKYFIDKRISVFAISNYLNNYFQSKGIDSTRIPIMLDMTEIPYEKIITSEKLKLLYAGSPGKKDYLNEIIEGLSTLTQEELGRIEFNIFGITESQLLEQCNLSAEAIRRCGKSLVVHGRVKRETVINQLHQTDFTVLLRSGELRYAKAGFPTKVVESLATATPVICNLTSDLGDYLKNGVNSLIVEACTAEAFTCTLRKALTLSLEEKQSLSFNARKTAEIEFDYRKFKKQFNAFLCKK